MDNKTYITEAMIATGLLSVLSAGAFGAFGAIVHYLYLIVKTDIKYSSSKMFLFAVLGFFVGVVMNELLLETFHRTYTGVILISGFLFMKILDLLSEDGLNILLRRVNIKKE